MPPTATTTSVHNANGNQAHSGVTVGAGYPLRPAATSRRCPPSAPIFQKAEKGGGVKTNGEMYYTSGTLPTRYTFTGQYSNVSDFGLMYYNARWYDPALSRFTSADTIIPQPGNPQSWDRYSYVNNSPLMYTDPSGHFSEDAITDYLMGYFEGDEEAALRTLQLWKQNTAWWKMISAAQGGDILFGMSGKLSTEGNSQSQFQYEFTGSGQEQLTGIKSTGPSPWGYPTPDLVEIQSQKMGYQRTEQEVGYNVIGFIRFEGNLPSFWHVGYERIERTTSDDVRDWTDNFMYGIGVLSGLKTGSVQVIVNLLSVPFINDLWFDMMDIEKGDVQVYIGPCHFNFQQQFPYGNYVVEPQ